MVSMSNIGDWGRLYYLKVYIISLVQHLWEKNICLYYLTLAHCGTRVADRMLANISLVETESVQVQLILPSCSSPVTMSGCLPEETSATST